MKLSEFDYDLPESLIAQRPLDDRSAARLLVASGTAPFAHRHIRDLPALLESGDLLVFNDTRVIPARLLATKATGGAVEVFLVRPLGGVRFEAMMRKAKGAKPGTRFEVGRGFSVVVEKSAGGGFYEVTLETDDVYAALDRYGHIPLPPYIKRGDDAQDKHQYQTMFAREPGSSAAPTAGLHFTDALLAALEARGVRHTRLTLHVGAGTFLPVRDEAEEDIHKHVMHLENFDLGAEAAAAINAAKAAGKRVVAVGTTSTRTLETVAQRLGKIAPLRGETGLFLTPGSPFRVVDALVTNFHLPRSTLLMLVSAFIGLERTRALYAEAVREQYRFFSYGDACLLEPARRA